MSRKFSRRCSITVTRMSSPRRDFHCSISRIILTRRGLESNGYRAPLERLAAVGCLAIVLINVRGYSHFVVLQGIRDGWVLLADPANGLRSETVSEFESQWSGVFFLVLTNVEQAQQYFADDRRWSSAPAPPWELARYAIDLTNLARPAMLEPGAVLNGGAVVRSRVKSALICTALIFPAAAGCSSPLLRSGQTFGTSPRIAAGPAAREAGRENVAAAALDDQTLACHSRRVQRQLGSHRLLLISARQRSSTTTWPRVSSCRRSPSRRIRQLLRSSLPPGTVPSCPPVSLPATRRIRFN